MKNKMQNRAKRIYVLIQGDFDTNEQFLTNGNKNLEEFKAV